MMKELLYYAVFLLLTTSAYAQDTTSATFYKHDVGFNTSFVLNSLFGTENSSSFDLMFKQQISPSRANRLGISLDYYTMNGTTVSGMQLDEIRFNLALTLGKEWQQTLSTRWRWYGGGDVVPRFRVVSQYVEHNNIPSQNTDTHVFGVSARPFLGIRFQINERLYVSTEASLSLGFNLHRGKNIDYLDENGDGRIEEIENEVNSFETFIRVTPASGIYFFYSF
uniref:Outer membrane protein beta-barrel domain-containing protein n=1 Tax=Roseihalotalea indica TaxID=2867963 RepID=A0AA49JHP4_9BACT|nr:hypothetical protein K4G66_11925 [Tunicatimonas sp. TK19036]